MNQIVCSVPQGLNPNTKTLQILGDSGLFMEVPFEIRPVKMIKTPEEKKKARRLYRKEYVTRPAVQEKIKHRLNDPESLQKRQQYAERADVKQRKKELAARARAIRKALKEEQPEIYATLLSKVSHS